MQIKDIQPAPGIIIVEPIREEAKGFITPKSDNPSPQWGKVISYAPPKEDDPKLPISVGQTIVFKKWGGNDLKVAGKKYFFLTYSEVIGLCQKD